MHIPRVSLDTLLTVAEHRSKSSKYDLEFLGCDQQCVNPLAFTSVRSVGRRPSSEHPQRKVHRDDFHPATQEQQVVLMRLRTELNRLNSCMHRELKLAPSPTCPWDQDDQDTEHALHRCFLHKATREDVSRVSSPLTTELYGCNEELEKTSTFVNRAVVICETPRTGPRRHRPGQSSHPHPHPSTFVSAPPLSS